MPKQDTRPYKVESYTITFAFNSIEDAPLYTGNAQYRIGAKRMDYLKITSRQIEIRCKRNLPIEKNAFELMKTNFETKDESSLCNQSTKALCLYYALSRRPDRIDSITLKQDTAPDLISSHTWTNAEIQQVLSASSTLSNFTKISAAAIDKILDEDKLGKSCLTALTYYLKSCDSANQQSRFENLWKSFNALYKAKIGKTKDKECLVNLRAYMMSNQSLFPVSDAYCDRMTATDIKKNTKWNKYIQNDYPGLSSMDFLKGSIQRIDDYRIAEVYAEKIIVRKDLLTTKGLFPDVENHLKQKMELRTKNNTDVIATLILRYGYYIRNKYAHAEKNDSSFNFFASHPVDAQLKWISDALEVLIIDLFNLCKSF